MLLLTFTFRSSTRLATAYGVAVTGTFLITTTLFLCVARARWKWRAWRVAVFGTVFGVIELTYFAANLTKVTHGGWLTLGIAAVVCTVMLTWQRGREIVTARRNQMEGSLPEFIDKVHADRVLRVPGTAVFPHPTKDTTPLALRANLQYNRVLHEWVVLISGRTENVPHIPWEQRLTVDHLGDPNDGILHVDARFGGQDPTDFPAVLRQAAIRNTGGPEGEFDPGTASYFLSRITVNRTRRPGMSA